MSTAPGSAGGLHGSLLEVVSKPISERGTVPFCSEDSAKRDSPRSVLKLLLINSFISMSPLRGLRFARSRVPAAHAAGYTTSPLRGYIPWNPRRSRGLMAEELIAVHKTTGGARYGGSLTGG
jgi:hypothetical protein